MQNLLFIFFKYIALIWIFQSADLKKKKREKYETNKQN